MTKGDPLIESLSRLTLSAQTEMSVIRRELFELGSIRGRSAASLAKIKVALERRGVDPEILADLAAVGMNLHATTFSTVEKQLNQIHNRQTMLPLGMKPFEVVQGSCGDGKVDGIRPETSA